MARPATSLAMAPFNSLPPGHSNLYRRLTEHHRTAGPVVAAMAAAVRTRLGAGLEVVRDGDDLAEVCFRLTGKHARDRDAHLALAAAVLHRLAQPGPAAPGVTGCGSFDGPPPPAPSAAATPSCTLPAQARTVRP